MSEIQPKHSHESHGKHSEELKEASEHLERLHNKLEREATEASKSNSQEQLEASAKQEVERQATTSENMRHIHEEAPQKSETRGSSKAEQEVSLTQTMTRVRKKLSIAEKPLSKVIHNPVVDKVSEVTGKTIARPSGLLGGAFFALVGTSALLWITRHYGYEYNYLAVILLFGLGMVAGLALEALIRTKKITQKD